MSEAGYEAELMGCGSLDQIVKLFLWAVAV